MRDLDKPVDAYVCQPKAHVSQTLRTVFVEFEHMDIHTMEGTGKSLVLGLTTSDAMWLLKVLQKMRDHHGLPTPEGQVVEGPRQSRIKVALTHLV
jgi:hypothetical protein